MFKTKVFKNYNMEVFENSENKASDIHLMDFPFVCRICLRRGDLRLFEQEDYLLDLFLAITKIDVRSAVNFPSNICNECINELEEISLFIDISKYNDSRPGKNIIPKKENEFVAMVDFGTFQEPVVKAEKITEEYEEDVCTEKPEMCRICLVPSCLTAFEEKTDLMQLFQNITNIDLEAASNSSSRTSICNECINKLESISLFISLSLSNDMKIASIIGRNESLKTENCSEGNAIGMNSSKCDDMKFDNISDRKEVKMGNYLNESVCSYESKDLHTRVDIKEEILCSPEAPIYVEKLGPDPNENEFSTENHPYIIPKGLNGSPKAHFQTERFECDCCKKSFGAKSCLKQHMPIHTGDKPFKCDSCQKGFRLKFNLKMHMFTHTGEKPLKCDCCEKQFSRAAHLNRHMLTHTGEKPFKCDSCQKSFGRVSHLKQHKLTHIGAKPFKCDSCQKGFGRVDHLKRHTLTHIGAKPFQCDCCHKCFSTKHHLKLHMLIHTEERPFECNSCKKGFTRVDHLKQHMLTHTGVKRFKCDICESDFSRKRVLNQHMRIHTGEKLFKCDCCIKTFTQVDRFKQHMFTHTGERPFKCDCCKKTFTRVDRLKQHMHIHTGEKPFKCDCCKKTFTRVDHLKGHMLTHTGEKPFKCDGCQKGFSRKCNLKKHMLTHTGEKLFICDICETDFSQKGNLKRHMLTHTGEKPVPV